MIEINRLWDFSGFDLKPNLKVLFKRPRVDYRISEYVFDYINKNILIKNNIMQKGDYLICLSFKIFDKNIHKYFKNSPYNNLESTKYDSSIKNRIINGEKYRDIHIICRSDKIDEKINPQEYANIVYDMIGVFLIEKYKKITKETMDTIKTGMDYDFIKKFKFPASFNNQKYITDVSNITWSSSDGKVIEEMKTLNIKEEYIKYYGEK
jgi:hypothetical protein